MSDVGNCAACYRIEKRGTPENSWGGCWEECRENSGCWTECRRGCCEEVFLGKESGTAPSPALPPTPRIFAALFPAPSPAIFWGFPILYSVAGRAVPKSDVNLGGSISPGHENLPVQSSMVVTARVSRKTRNPRKNEVVKT